MVKSPYTNQPGRLAECGKPATLQPFGPSGKKRTWLCEEHAAFVADAYAPVAEEAVE